MTALSPSYKWLRDNLNQNLEQWVMPKVLDVTSLNDTPENLTHTLRYAADTAHNLAASVKAQHGRTLGLTCIIVKWDTLTPVHLRGASADLALSMETFGILIAEACRDIFTIRKLWAEEAATAGLKYEGEGGSEVKRYSPPSAKKVKVERTSRACHMTKPTFMKSIAKPEADLTTTMEYFKAAEKRGDHRAARQFIHSFCHCNHFHELPQYTPTWSDIAFITGCRFERSRDRGRMADAVPDLVYGLATVAYYILALAEGLESEHANNKDTTYHLARTYIDKWSPLTGENLYQTVGGPVAAWHAFNVYGHWAATRMLCMTLADACRDVVDLRPYARAKVDSGDTGPLILMGFRWPATTGCLCMSCSLSAEGNEAKEEGDRIWGEKLDETLIGGAGAALVKEERMKEERVAHERIKEWWSNGVGVKEERD